VCAESDGVALLLVDWKAAVAEIDLVCCVRSTLASAVANRLESGSDARAGRCCCSGRVAATPEFAATRRLLREAKRKQLIGECDVRPRDCVPTHGRVRAWSRSTVEQTVTTAVGLKLGSDDGPTGRLVSTGDAPAGAGAAECRASNEAITGRVERVLGRLREVSSVVGRDLLSAGHPVTGCAGRRWRG
jgi:hypothetical protein